MDPTGIRRRRVLVVENDYYLSDAVARAIASIGATVLGPFPREDDAIAAMERERPDRAVLDLNLGGGASFHVADLLRERGVPFLLFTGYDRHVVPARFADVVHLQKPVKAGRLLLAVLDLCR